MREILFKAKRLDNGEWVEGYYIYHIKRTLSPVGDWLRPEDEQHVIMKDGFSDWNMPRDTVHYDIDPNTLCEFTGLRDKNGRRIWEGDIVLSQERDTRPYSKNKKSKRLKGVVYYDIGSGNGFYNKETQKWDRYMEWSSEWRVKFNEDERMKYHCSSWGDFWDCEVIGNIYDNPELIVSDDNV